MVSSKNWILEVNENDPICSYEVVNRTQIDIAIDDDAYFRLMSFDQIFTFQL